MTKDRCTRCHHELPAIDLVQLILYGQTLCLCMECCKLVISTLLSVFPTERAMRLAAWRDRWAESEARA